VPSFSQPVAFFRPEVLNSKPSQTANRIAEPLRAHYPLARCIFTLFVLRAGGPWMPNRARRQTEPPSHRRCRTLLCYFLHLILLISLLPDSLARSNRATMRSQTRRPMYGWVLRCSIISLQLKWFKPDAESAPVNSRTVVLKSSLVPVASLTKSDKPLHRHTPYVKLFAICRLPS
jgi:hypothetical protein